MMLMFEASFSQNSCFFGFVFCFYFFTLPTDPKSEKTKTFPAFHLSTVYEQATTQQKPKGIQSTCTVGNACLWNIESGKNSLRNPKSFVLESEIKLKESKIPKDWSLEIKFHLQRLECNNWNLESKTVLDSLSCGNIQFCSIAVTSFWWNIFCSSFSRRLQAMQLKKSVGSLRMKIMQSR